MPSSLNGTGVTFNDTTTQATAYIGHRGQVFTSSGTFTVPTGVSSIKVTVVGGGGGGGVGIDGSYGGPAGGPGGNGGGGGTSFGYVAVTPGASYAVVVGSGGNGSNSGTGGSGGTSSFGSTLLTASGGAGGSNSGGGANGSGGGTLRDSLLNPNSGFINNFVRARQTSGTAALIYAIGNIVSRSAGAGGSGATAGSTFDAVGGISGAVLVEW
jgi:hypothetical protein